MIYRTTEVKVDPTPEELAREFSSMDAEQQAEFFNKLSLFVQDWPGNPGMQWIYVKDGINPEAVRMLENLLDHLQ